MVEDIFNSVSMSRIRASRMTIIEKLKVGLVDLPLAAYRSLLFCAVSNH